MEETQENNGFALPETEELQAPDGYEERSKETLIEICRAKDGYITQLRNQCQGAMNVADFIAFNVGIVINDVDYEMYCRKINRDTPVAKAVCEWDCKEEEKERKAYELELRINELEQENKTLKSLLTTAWALEA